MPKKIRPIDLKGLGYRLSGKQIPIRSSKPKVFTIMEVFNEDNQRELSFCYLFNSRVMSGIILPNPFHYYRLHKAIDADSLLNSFT